MTNATYDLLEDAVQKALKQVDFSATKDDASLRRATELTQLLIATDKEDMEYHDKKDRRDLEKAKNDATITLEREKSKLTWGRVGFEMAKVLIPLAVSMYVSDKWQRRMLKFEETGRFTSSVSREFHLPKLLK